MAIHLNDGISTPPAGQVTIAEGTNTTTLDSGTRSDINLSPNRTSRINSIDFQAVEINTISIQDLNSLNITLFNQAKATNLITGTCQIIINSGNSHITGTCATRDTITNGGTYSVNRKNENNAYPPLVFTGQNISV